MKSYQTITDRVIELLEQGVVPWRKPWVGGPAGHPKNLSSGHRYRGVNVFMLHAAGFDSPWWLTFKQAKSRGGHVRKGEKGWPVVFWKWLEKPDPDKPDKIKRLPMLRHYSVFNVGQCEGIDAPAPPSTMTFDFDPIESAESIIAAMPERPPIRHDEGRAVYYPSPDYVNMPKPERFERPEGYYSTLFHELTHATGHARRLDRKTLTDYAPFGSATYSREELVAEMGAAFLCGESGIVDGTIENSAAYMAGWLRKLRDDPRLVVTAAAQAQKAADFILDRQTGEGDGS